MHSTLLSNMTHYCESCIDTHTCTAITKTSLEWNGTEPFGIYMHVMLLLTDHVSRVIIRWKSTKLH